MRGEEKKAEIMLISYSKKTVTEPDYTNGGSPASTPRVGPLLGIVTVESDQVLTWPDYCACSNYGIAHPWTVFPTVFQTG